VSLLGSYRRLGPRQTELLTLLRAHPDGIAVDDVQDKLGLSGDDHFNKLVHDLRKKLETVLRGESKRLEIEVENKRVTAKWYSNATV
jgi:hypothetical protein